MKTEPAADHVFDIVTFIISLISLLQVWLERVPIIKWLWPRAWDMRRMFRRASTDDGSVALDHLRTDLERSPELKKVLSHLEDLQSGQQVVLERLTDLENRLKDREDELSRNGHQKQRVDRLLSSLEGAVATLQARTDAPSTGCERCHVLEEATHHFLSRARAIQDRKV
ncbi:hypothetical protein P168DRAFT_321228 [Aspergillus campestris IBT 28561]|uniref:Uncharacterized protein n=1 Tax=Aspergillus campestris (strain IBT 28561) TaxID=1392248 RepID=A0A2I1CVK2_ASPC2|nr:uncharacterized protein P168DRAFT_321228 [Aspergillus campestris IBT 28561]PKY01650.1 hypothetical protein P168DRAFT_321228 [Aspergillus campestris IBT 28561]